MLDARGKQLNKNAGLSVKKAARAGAMALGLGLIFAFPLNAANAGFFDFLFAPFHPAPAQPSLSDQYLSQPKKKKFAHRPKDLVARVHPGRDGRGRQAPTNVSLMDDESLRNGDVVMTSDGLRIFTGSAGARHSDDDFAKISETEGLSAARRSALVFIDAGAADARAAQPALLDGRSVAEASATNEGETIIDPHGNKIRYVGP